MLFNNTPLLVLIALLTTAAVAAPAPGYKRPQPPQRKGYQSHRAPPYPFPKTHPEHHPDPSRNEPSRNEPEGNFPSVNFDPDLLDLDILNIGKEKRSTENDERRGRGGDRNDRDRSESRSKSRGGEKQGPTFNFDPDFIDIDAFNIGKRSEEDGHGNGGEPTINFDPDFIDIDAFNIGKRSEEGGHRKGGEPTINFDPDVLDLDLLNIHKRAPQTANIDPNALDLDLLNIHKRQERGNQRGRGRGGRGSQGPPRNSPTPESFPSINFDPDLLDLDLLNIHKRQAPTSHRVEINNKKGEVKVADDVTVHFNPEAVQVEVDGQRKKRSEKKEEEFKINIDPDFVDIDFGNIGKRNIIEPVYDVPVVGGVVRGTGVGAGEEQRRRGGQQEQRRHGGQRPQRKEEEEEGDLEVVDGMDTLLQGLPIIGGSD